MKSMEKREQRTACHGGYPTLLVLLAAGGWRLHREVGVDGQSVVVVCEWSEMGGNYAHLSASAHASSQHAGAVARWRYRIVEMQDPRRTAARTRQWIGGRCAGGEGRLSISAVVLWWQREARVAAAAEKAEEPARRRT